jgi:hypothetical protein
MIATWKDRLSLTGPVVVIAFLALITPSDDGPTVCPFALLTGTACPGCGMTRAASYLLRGDWATAIDYHPLAPLFVMTGLAGWGWYLLRRAGKVEPLPPRLVQAALIGAGVMLLGVWVARAALGTLPPV